MAVDIPDDGHEWAARSQDGLRAIRVGGIVVAPPWNVPAANPGAIVIVIRPSMGFGTGHHASTRLCLQALQDQAPCDAAVTDLGTGSGVLAIAASKLGARSVVALECDPDAAAAAEDNIRTNEVEHLVTLVRGDLGRTTPPRAAQVVVANLTGAVLCQRADDVARCVAPDGTLILAGVTREEETTVGQSFASVARPTSASRNGVVWF